MHSGYRLADETSLGRAGHMRQRRVITATTFSLCTFAEAENGAHNSLVLYGVQRAGGIDQTTSGSQQLQTTVQDTQLKPGIQTTRRIIVLTVYSFGGYGRIPPAPTTPA